MKYVLLHTAVGLVVYRMTDREFTNFKVLRGCSVRRRKLTNDDLGADPWLQHNEYVVLEAKRTRT